MDEIKEVRSLIEKMCNLMEKSSASDNSRTPMRESDLIKSKVLKLSKMEIAPEDKRRSAIKKKNRAA